MRLHLFAIKKTLVLNMIVSLLGIIYCINDGYNIRFNYFGHLSYIQINALRYISIQLGGIFEFVLCCIHPINCGFNSIVYSSCRADARKFTRTWQFNMQHSVGNIFICYTQIYACRKRTGRSSWIDVFICWYLYTIHNIYYLLYARNKG